MKIVKIWLLIITFATLCFGANAQEMQKIFDSKKPLHEKLTNDFTNYPNMDEAKKQQYEKDMQKLLDVEFLIKQFRIDANTTKETYEIFAPYINSHSYFIARYLPYNYIDASLYLMSGVMKYAPNDAYMETKDREKSAKFLLEHGVDKNTTYKDRQILFNAVENYFSEEFVKYLISIGCDKNYFKDTFVSSTAYNPYIYATVFRSDFYSKELILSLKPDDYKDTKYALICTSVYLKNKFYDIS